MPTEWDLTIEFPIFTGRSDIRHCSFNRAMKLLEHEIIIIIIISGETVLDKRFHRIVIVNDVGIGFMPVRGTVNAVFILRRLQEEYHAKGKVVYVHCGPRESC